MLQFSDLPYQFFPRRASRFFRRLGRIFNAAWVLQAKNHRIEELLIQGDRDQIKKLASEGHQFLFVANHPSHSDPQVMTEVMRQLRIPFCFMAAYDVFLRGRFIAWCMQRLGHFSVDRDGSDRKSIATAMEVLSASDDALILFPEGNVYLTNGRITPLQDGAAFMALRASSKMPEGKTLYIVPVSLDFSLVAAKLGALTARIETLASDSEFSGKLPLHTPSALILELGQHLLKRQLTSLRWDEVPNLNHDLPGELPILINQLLQHLEEELSMSPSKGSVSAFEAIKRIRARIHKDKLASYEIDQEGMSQTDLQHLSDIAILVYRLIIYSEPYFSESPTLDRFSETIERLREDFYSAPQKPHAPRRCTVNIAEPIAADQWLLSHESNLKKAIPALTKEIEREIQCMLDKSRASLPTIGNQPMPSLEKGTEPA